MALDIDTRNPLRRPGELTELVRAIMGANPNDESNWLEWKGSLDLTSAAGRLHIAKGVLGLANRMPGPAVSNCGGVGYVVIGCEPGSLAGVAPIDPAQLDDGLSPYLGGVRGPVWGATYVEVDDCSVAVVTVEPPAEGDRIFTLRKAYDKYSTGTVFVRRNGKTAPADDHEMDLLQTRLRIPSRDALEVDVSVVGDVPLSWFDPSTVKSAIQSWAESRRSTLVAEAERVERGRTGQGTAARVPVTGFQQLAASLERLGRLPNPLVKPDERTLEDYTAEVEAWTRRLAELGISTWHARYLKHGHGIIRLKVTNPSDRNIKDVMVKATFPSEDVVGLDERPYTERLPKPPRKYGEPVRFDIGFSHMPIGLGDRPIISSIPPMRSTWVEDGSMRIGWSVGDLRPRETKDSDDVYVFVQSRASEGILKGVWEATSKSTDGVLEGELLVPVAEEPVAVAALFEVSDDE